MYVLRMISTYINKTRVSEYTYLNNLELKLLVEQDYNLFLLFSSFLILKIFVRIRIYPGFVYIIYIYIMNKYIPLYNTL